MVATALTAGVWIFVTGSDSIVFSFLISCSGSVVFKDTFVSLTSSRLVASLGNVVDEKEND